MLARIHDRRALEQRNLYLPESLPNAITEPENVIAPTNVPMNSSTRLPYGRNRIACRSDKAERRRLRHHRIRDTHRRKTDQRVHRGDQFRHLGHLDARRDERADRAADDQRREQQAKP